jgi:hypothetical protein
MRASETLANISTWLARAVPAHPMAGRHACIYTCATAGDEEESNAAAIASSLRRGLITATRPPPAAASESFADEGIHANTSHTHLSA